MQQAQNDPLSLVQYAINKQREGKLDKNPYDAIWLFLDHDQHPKLEQAFRLMQRYMMAIF
ncbi:MAG: hypothetical protein JNN12_08890 [Bacteroidetes Order II. Incertae sedis bacterium]|nr:hypothetical protein [Bacteroidetes Order II. bacterium]